MNMRNGGDGCPRRVGALRGGWAPDRDPCQYLCRRQSLDGELDPLLVQYTVEVWAFLPALYLLRVGTWTYMYCVRGWVGLQSVRKGSRFVRKVDLSGKVDYVIQTAAGRWV